jgi:tetratricopeptide (TPR) repeat protein
MTILLHAAARKIAFFVITLAPCLLLLRVALRPALADHVAAQRTAESLRRTTEIEPSNAERYFAYGRFLALAGDNASAAWNFRAATQLNPRNSRYWIELARAEHFLGDTQANDSALQNAVRYDPTNSDIALEAANFFLSKGSLPDAVREYRVALDYDAGLSAGIFDRLWANTHDANLLIDQALPPDARYHPALLSLFIAHDQPQAAAEVWKRWMGLAGETPASASFPDIDYLLKRGEYESAAHAWSEFATHSEDIRKRESKDNLLLNGDFEYAVLGGGFEWRYRRNPLASLELDSTRFHSGNSSLRIDFNGQNGDDAGIAQFVIVPPNTAITFRGFMRTEAIYSAHGPCFSITDVATGTPLYTGDESIGTTAWTERTGSVPASPAWRVVALRVTREPGSHISGHAWIDDLTLTAESH